MTFLPSIGTDEPCASHKSFSFTEGTLTGLISRKKIVSSEADSWPLILECDGFYKAVHIPIQKMGDNFITKKTNISVNVYDTNSHTNQTPLRKSKKKNPKQTTKHSFNFPEVDCITEQHAQLSKFSGTENSTLCVLL